MDPKGVAQMATAANTPLNSTLASFNNAYMSNTLNFEDPSAVVSADQQQLLHGAHSSSNASLRRSGSAPRGGRSPERNSANNAYNGNNNSSSNNMNSNAGRLRRSGSSGTLQQQQQLTPTGEWNASTKDSAIRDDWMNDTASLSVASSSSPSRARNHTLLSAAQKGGLSIVAPINWLLLFRAEVQKALDEGRCREMTLNEVTETIQKLYQSKVIANEKANRGIGEFCTVCCLVSYVLRFEPICHSY